MLQKNKAEAKRYGEENITIMSMIISSSHSYIYHIFLKFYTIAGVLFCRQRQTDRQTDTERGGGVGGRQTDRKTG